MIPIKSPVEIQSMREGGKILAKVMKEVISVVRPGITTLELDQMSERLIGGYGAKASFKMVKGYKWASCININEGVVHGIPSADIIIKDGDLVTFDLGVSWKEFNTDMARTIIVQKSNTKNQKYEEAIRFLNAGEEAMERAREAAKVGNRVGDISMAIDKTISEAGFSPIEALTGHGVGRELHEEPQISCIAPRVISRTPALASGMTLAIEIIYARGKKDVFLAEDDWTISTQDGGLAAVIEDTILVTAGKAEVLTAA